MALYEYSIPYQVIETPLSASPFMVAEVNPAENESLDVRQRMMMVLAVVLLLVVLGGATLAPRTQLAESVITGEITVQNAVETAVAQLHQAASSPTQVVTGKLSPVFAAPVHHWEPQILAWAAEHNLDPDIVATIMQIESCGDPRAQSHAGATGLFQVMPFHFEPGEDAFDPATNAFRGMSFYNYVLGLSKGDVGRALAGYNGGPRAALSSWDSWVSETRRYYTWGMGIYADAKAGLTESPTLQQWLQAGGASLCRQAANRLGLN